METTGNTNEISVKVCGCGCGEPVARRFKPGHDARLKSALVTATTSNRWWERLQAAETLVELGWLHFANPEDLAKISVRSRGTNGRFTESRHIAHVENANWTHVDEKGNTHAHPECGSIVGKTTAHKGCAAGWLCTTCVHTEDWNETAARQMEDAWFERNMKTFTDQAESGLDERFSDWDEEAA